MTDEASGGGPGSRAASAAKPAVADPGRGRREDILELGAFAADAQRDMREILSSIRRLMREPMAEEWSSDGGSGAGDLSDPSASPGSGRISEANAERDAAARRRALARRFETVSPPPRAPVDEWPDDPEIDVDALADELLRGAQALSGTRAASEASSPGGALSETRALSSGDAPATRGAAWGELEALLTMAQEALDGAQMAADTLQNPALASESAQVGPPRAGLTASDLAQRPTVQCDAEATEDLVAFPVEALPDAEAVLEAAQPYQPQAGLAAPESGSTAAGSAEPDAPEDAPEDAPDTTGEAAPASGPLGPGDATPLDGDAAIARAPLDETVVEVAEVVPVGDRSEPAVAPGPAGSSSVPDDPRNAPGPGAVRTLAEIGAMVRDAAQRNHDAGSGTYQGAAPHPGIARLIGWRAPAAEDTAQDGGAEAERSAARPGPKELALQALEPAGEERAALDAAPAPRAGEESPEAASQGSAESLRPLLAGWLEENLPQLLENLVREEMARLAQKPKDQ
ncbi:MAG: DUF2497 domain-containing protein [Pseudomonadota bacterium]